MESLQLNELIQEARQTNQLLTELNNNFIALIEALGMEEEPSVPMTDMDGNAVCP